MIFVTVGTHEQPFDRLIKQIDILKSNNKINQKVIIQRGFSNYLPKYCESYKMLSYEEMKKFIHQANIVITHGGPATFIEVLQSHKIPIVVPRMKKFNEHINNHQVEFVELVYKKMNNIIPVYDINELQNVIINYDKLVDKMNPSEQWNNEYFNKSIEEIAENLVK